jgi:hypothetical protein
MVASFDHPTLALYLLMYNRWRKQFLFDLIGRCFDHSPKRNPMKKKEISICIRAPWCVGTWRRRRAKDEMDRLPTPLKREKISTTTNYL